MPTFYGRKTGVQLSVAELARVITPNPRPRQCVETTSSIAKTELEFANASKHATLAEESLSGQDGRHLRFLGSNEDMPFFLVRAGKDFLSPDVTAKRTRRPAKTLRQQTTDKVFVYDSGDDEIEEETEIITAGKANTGSKNRSAPCALCLTVFLTRASFSHIRYENGSKKTVENDIKIDVYFDGQFVDSQIINHKQFSSASTRGMRARIARFTGQKLSRMIEKPWVFVPPGQVADRALNGSPDHARTKWEGANLRWTSISKNLSAEAAQNTIGDRPVSADYLSSLASVPIPSEVTDMQLENGLRFGVIDVVVIWGNGQKDGPDCTYLTKPTRTRAERFPTEFNANAAGHLPAKLIDHSISVEPYNDSTTATPAPQPRRTSPYMPKMRNPSSSATPKPISQTRASVLATALTLDGSIDQPSKPHYLIGHLFPPARSHTPNQKRPRPASTSANPSKRRMPYHHVVTTKQTLAEEFQSIAEQMIDNVEMRRTRAKVGVGGNKETETVDSKEREEVDEVMETSSLSSVPGSVEEVSLVEEPKERLTVKLKISPEKMGRIVTKRRMSLRGKSGIGSSASPPGDGNTFDSSATSRAAPTSGRTLASNMTSSTTPAPSRRRSQTFQPSTSPEVSAFDADFVLPELSKGCCVTYAERGVVRNVGAVRGGWFDEKGVVIGVRFVVG